MAKKPEGPVTIHDHFDGSAHCMECRGPCQLTGESMFATYLVRAIVETWDHKKVHPRGFAADVMLDFGLDPVSMLIACQEANERAIAGKQPRWKSSPTSPQGGKGEA